MMVSIGIRAMKCWSSVGLGGGSFCINSKTHSINLNATANANTRSNISLLLSLNQEENLLKEKRKRKRKRKRKSPQPITPTASTGTRPTNTFQNNTTSSFAFAPSPTNHSSSPNINFSSSSSSSSAMESCAELGLYPLHHTKILHLVRHAQGFHNVAGEKDVKLYESYDYLDASLTPLGWDQVDNLRKHVHATALFNNIELVITSPLTRTMQTAVGVFGGGGYSDSVDVTQLMVADAGNSGRPAISSLNCPPFLAIELCREHLGVHPCDKRRSKTEYQSVFPAIDFSLIESDEDILWKEDIREKDEEVAERGMKFLNWLWSRKEKEIAIVSHSGFLFNTLSAFGNDCHQIVKNEICTPFKNCELRSMVFVDKSLVSFDSSTTNFPGKVPSGPDLPSDIADEKLA